MTTNELLVISSFSKDLWDRYASACIKSQVKHIKPSEDCSVRFLFTVDGVIPDLSELILENPGVDIRVESLDNQPEYMGFVNRNSKRPIPNVPPDHQFRFEFLRFWPKVYTIVRAYEISQQTHCKVLWLDADMAVRKDVDASRIVEDLYVKPRTEDTYSFVCLDRGAPWGYMDSGYFLFHKFTSWQDTTGDFIRTLGNLYDTDTLFEFQQWHDAYLFTQIMKMLWGEDRDKYVLSLSGRVDTSDPREYLNPITKTWLGEYFTHFKGNLKTEVLA